MRKKIIAIFIAVVMVSSIGFMAASCSGSSTPGKSAYEIAVDNGYPGTETEWLASLKGTNGTNGTNGTGTPGAPGENGNDGATWLTGEGAPAATLGAIGDFYFDSDTNKVYKKTAAETWTEIADLTGEAGTPGTPGQSVTTYTVKSQAEFNDLASTLRDGDFVVNKSGKNLWAAASEEGLFLDIPNKGIVFYSNDGFFAVSANVTEFRPEFFVQSGAKFGTGILEAGKVVQNTTHSYKVLDAARAEFSEFNANVQVAVNYGSLQADGQYTRVLKVEQITGVDGDAQFFMLDEGDDADFYWDVLNNAGDFTELLDNPKSEAIKNLLAEEDYTGYWSAVLGNTKSSASLSELNGMFAAKTAGLYVITCDVYKLNGDGTYEFAGTNTEYVYVTDRDVYNVAYIGDLLTFTNYADFDYAYEVAAPSGIETNVNIKYNGVADLTDGDKYTRVFKSEQLRGTQGGDVQLLAFDGVYGGKEVYWDILNNEQDFLDNTDPAKLSVITKLLSAGYTGYWGAVAGNTKAAGSALNIDATFVADEEGLYAITCDIYKLDGSTYTLAGSSITYVYVAKQNVIKAGSVSMGTAIDSDYHYFVATANKDTFNKFEANVTVNYDLKGLTDGDKYTRAFKVEGPNNGDAQLFALDAAADGDNYWDILNDAAFAVATNGATPALTSLLATNGYTGYWGAVAGNTYGTTSAQSLSAMFVATVEGIYAVTCDIYKLNTTDGTSTLVGSTVTYVWVVAAAA